MEFKKIDIGRQGNFLLALLLIHFVFFGIISNVWRKTLGMDILFLQNVMFNSRSYLSCIVLFLIIFQMTFRENFYEYGIRNSLWTIPFIIVESWIWYWFIEGEFNIGIIGTYFIQIESYISILSVLAIILSASLLGAMAKEKYKRFIAKAQILTTE